MEEQHNGGAQAPPHLVNAVRAAIRSLIPELALELANEVAQCLNESGWEIFVKVSGRTIDRLQGIAWQLCEVRLDLRATPYLERIRHLSQLGFSETDLRRVIMFYCWRWANYDGRQDQAGYWRPVILDPKRAADALAEATMHREEIVKWSKKVMILRRVRQSMIGSRAGDTSGTGSGATGGRSKRE